jgi:hypothetical protein
MRDRGMSEQRETHAGGYRGRHRQGEVSHAVFALVGTIVGGGCLSLPWALDQCGYALGLGCLCLACSMACVSVHFLLAAARRHGGLRSYNEVMRVVGGRWAEGLTIFCVVITTFLTLVANQLLLRQLLSPLAAHYLLGRKSAEPLSHWEAVAVGSIAVLFVLPLTFLPTLNSLRHVGFLSVASVTTLVVVMMIKAAQCVPPPYDEAPSEALLSFPPDPLLLALSSAPVATVATPLVAPSARAATHPPLPEVEDDHNAVADPHGAAHLRLRLPLLLLGPANRRGAARPVPPPYELDPTPRFWGELLSLRWRRHGGLLVRAV